MRIIRNVYLLELIFFILNIEGLSGQTIELSKRQYHLETQKIFNTVIKSIQFDNVIDTYRLPIPIFVENDYLPSKYHLVYKGRKISIIDNSHSEGKTYWIFGHYVIDITTKKPTTATLQLSVISNDKELLIGVRLVKSEQWKIEFWNILVDGFS